MSTSSETGMSACETRRHSQARPRPAADRDAHPDRTNRSGSPITSQPRQRTCRTLGAHSHTGRMPTYKSAVQDEAAHRPLRVQIAEMGRTRQPPTRRYPTPGRGDRHRLLATARHKPSTSAPGPHPLAALMCLSWSLLTRTRRVGEPLDGRVRRDGTVLRAGQQHEGHKQPMLKLPLSGAS